VDQQQQGESILNVTRRLLALRKRRPLWQEGECEVTSLNQHILMVTRRFHGEEFYYAFNFGLNDQCVEWQGASLTVAAQWFSSNDAELMMMIRF
jgi:glycosidase